MRDRMYAITTPEEADQFVESGQVVAIFKAGTCHKTMQGWGNVEKLLRERPDILVGIIKVVEDRPASNRITERTGITHQSPQFILFRDGRPLFDLDNWDITLQNLEPLFAQHLADGKIEQAQNQAGSNLEPYKRLMDAYLGGTVGEQQFAWTYLNMFREDASLRSQEEFELLNSLFSNPDENHIHPLSILQHEQHSQATPLRERVEALRQRIEAL